MLFRSHCLVEPSYLEMTVPMVKAVIRGLNGLETAAPLEEAIVHEGVVIADLVVVDVVHVIAGLGHRAATSPSSMGCKSNL